MLYKLNSKFIKRNFHSNSSRRTSSGLHFSSTFTSEVQLVLAVAAFAYIYGCISWWMELCIYVSHFLMCRIIMFPTLFLNAPYLSPHHSSPSSSEAPFFSPFISPPDARSTNSIHILFHFVVYSRKIRRIKRKKTFEYILIYFSTFLCFYAL